MSNASGAMAWQDGPGSFAYALATADGRVYNWTTMVFEVMPATPAAAHLRPMAPKTFGLAQWSQDCTPPIVSQPVQLVALIFAVDGTGKPTGYSGVAQLIEQPLIPPLFLGR